MKPLQKVTNIFNYLCHRGKKPTIETPDKVFTDPLYFFAFGLGSGALSWAPGTWGTLLAIPFFLLISHAPLTIYLTIVLAFILFSIWVSDSVSREIQVHDHPGLNIDEFAGFLVTMIAVPAHLSLIILGFVLFRAFDIFKPFGIRYLDKHVGGGFGMVLDDVVAGIYSSFVLHIIIIIFY